MIRSSSLAVVLTLALAPTLHAQNAWRVDAPPPAGFDRTRAQADARRHLEQLVALRTMNPPGDEALTARYLDSVLHDRAGVETRIIDLGNGRANVLARLRAARATKRPVIIMAHMDVVGVDVTKWATNPFDATEKDGYIYGRGVIDDKGMLAASLSAFAQLAARRDSLDRDVILLGTAGEEGGGLGILAMVDKYFDLIKDAEFALNEGGRIRIKDGVIDAINIQVTEKIAYNVTVTAHGPSGHASVPLEENAIAALSRALARVHEWEPPIRLNAVTREYFRRLATIEDDDTMKLAMQDVAAARGQGQVVGAALVLSRNPLHSAVLRTTVSITQISGGVRNNVIPSEATANLNIRELPDGDIRGDLAQLNEIGGEPNVTFTLDQPLRVSPPASPPTSDMFKAMEAAGRTMAPGAIAIPFMSTGGTDGARLREHGIPTYGILPLPMLEEDELRMHGDNERLPVPALGWATEYLYRVLSSVASR